MRDAGRALLADGAHVSMGKVFRAMVAAAPQPARQVGGDELEHFSPVMRGMTACMERVHAGGYVRARDHIRALSAARNAVSDAARDVLVERKRQVEVEGWTQAHDDIHGSHELAEAAACYAMASAGKPFEYFQLTWPWETHWYKHSDPRRMLVKAGALILAEIERLERSDLIARQEQEVGNG
ncbi:hypothetical protein D9M70_548660 [compost metagenome]